MEEIRRRIAERKAGGQYTEAELAEISSMELRLQEAEECDGEIDRLISWLHAHWEATGPKDQEGVQPAGSLREALKKVLSTLMAPAGRVLLGKQNQINARLVQLLSAAVPALRQDMRDMGERIDKLTVTLETENARLRSQLQELSDRLRTLEEEAAGRKGRQGE